jgi:hypothetical protein
VGGWGGVGWASAATLVYPVTPGPFLYQGGTQALRAYQGEEHFFPERLGEHGARFPAYTTSYCNSPHCCRVEPKWRGHAHPRKRRAREPFTCFTSSALILIPGGPGGGEGPAIAGSRWWRARPWCGGRAACVTSKRGYEKKGKSERKGRREERKKKKRRSLSIIHSRRARTPIRHHHAIQTPTRHCPFFNCI